MSAWQRFWRRLRGSFAGARADREFQEELRAHLEMQVADNLRAGLSPGEALRQARLALGGFETARARQREQRGLPILDSLGRNLRLALRTLMRSSGFTLVALTVLALGTGANTLMFGVVNAVLLRPLPYPGASDLVLVQPVFSANDAAAAASVPDFELLRAQNRSFQGLDAFYSRSADIAGGSDPDPERVRALVVSAGFLGVLQTPPALGRDFASGDETWGEHRVVLLSDGLWRRRFGADANVVGQRLTLNAEPHTVIGVLPRGFSFVGRDAQLLVPMSFAPGDNLNSRNNFFLAMVGRPRPGVSPSQAQGDLEAIHARIAAEHPENRGMHIGVRGLQDSLVGEVRPSLYALLGAVALVLLIACANLASLNLARAAARRRDVALRIALGASRRSILMQFLTESVLLALAGSLLGLLLAASGVALVNSLSQAVLPRAGDVRLDGTVLAMTAAVALLIAVLAGLGPALRASGEAPNSALKEGSRTVGDSRGHRLRSLLVAAEVALCLVLLIGAGLLVESLRRLTGVDPGFVASDVVTFQLSVPRRDYVDDGLERQFSPLAYTKAAAFFAAAVREASAVTGVESAGAVNALPLMGEVWGKNATLYDRPLPATLRDLPTIQYRVVEGDYFGALGIRIVRGRSFTGADSLGAGNVAVVNEEMARLYWPQQDPVGKVLSVNPPRSLVPEGSVPADYEPTLFTIVGVAANARYGELRAAAPSLVYVPFAQGSEGTTGMYLAVRTASTPAAVIDAVRARLRRLDPRIPLSNVQTMQARVDAATGRPRLQAVILGSFAGLALLLSLVGVHGVMRQATEERMREVGIRMAMGADAASVLRLFLRHAFLLVAAGLAAGVAGAVALTRALRSMLFAVSPTEPRVYLALTLALGIAGALAAWLSARRATRLDPLAVLREE